MDANGSVAGGCFFRARRRLCGAFRHHRDWHGKIIMKICIILNDPPYGTERCFNGLRLALALLKADPQPELSVFLMPELAQLTLDADKVLVF